MINFLNRFCAFFNNKKCLVLFVLMVWSVLVNFYWTQNNLLSLQMRFCSYVKVNRMCRYESSDPLEYLQAFRGDDIYLEPHPKHTQTGRDGVIVTPFLKSARAFKNDEFFIEQHQKYDIEVDNVMQQTPRWNASFHGKLIQLIPALKTKYQSYLQPVTTLFSNSYTNLSQRTKKLLEHIVRSGYGLKPYKTERGEAAWIENGIIYRPSRRMNPDGFTPEFESYVPFDEDLFFEGRKRDARYKTKRKIIVWHTKPLHISKEQHLQPLAACPELPCFETTNKKYQAYSSALVLAASRIRRTAKLPKRSHPDQIWVLHNHEPPYLLRRFRRLDPSWKSVFNWTFTYRMDSDIITPYAVVRRRPKSIRKKQDYRAVLALKTGLIFWAVSNCHTHSRRELYVKELRKYIPVDQMGKCGGLKPCPKSIRENCTDSFAPKYKFYLAFESNLCRDYITEKLFNYMHKDMVIVARGNDDYYRHLPSETFINVNDFPSPKLLAERLWYLHRNEEAYLDILRAKDQYITILEDYMVTFPSGLTIHNDFQFLAVPMCLLCQRLWNLERHRKRIEDVFKWFEEGHCERSAATMSSSRKSADVSNSS